MQQPPATSRRRSPRSHTLLRRALLWRSLFWRGLHAAAGRFFGLLSWPTAQRVGRGLGSALWRTSRRDRCRILTHLELAFPELAAAEHRRLGRACSRHLGCSLAELLHLRYRDPAEVCRHVRVEGFEVIERLRAAGRPIVVLTGHCGNWELISAANCSHGLELVAMARRLDDPGLDAAVVGLRAHFGTLTIARGSRQASRDLLCTLRKGGALALLIDQDFVTEGVWVPFFGRLAFTPLAAANLALRLGAAVVPTFAERLDDGSHLVRFHDPLDLPTDPAAATALMTASIEGQIRRRPEQWVWMHRRWRRRPAEEASAAVTDE